jgi:hypothetical protein
VKTRIAPLVPADPSGIAQNNLTGGFDKQIRAGFQKQ